SVMTSRTNRFLPIVAQAVNDCAKARGAGSRTASAARSAVRRSARLTAPAYKEKARISMTRALDTKPGEPVSQIYRNRAGDFGRFNSRQRPTLPRTYARSTIGGGRLNFRVRNGNGCDPAPMTTGKLISEPALSRFARICRSWRARAVTQLSLVKTRKRFDPDA